VWRSRTQRQLLITTEAMVAEVPKKNAGAGGMPAGGGGMGGMDF
jgi:chaperonin GroEL